MTIEELQKWIKKNMFQNDKIIAGRITERWFNKNNKNVLYYIKFYTPFLEKNASISQRIWHILNEIFYIPVCKECGRKLKYIKFNRGYGEYCSKYCTNKMRNKKAHDNHPDWTNIAKKASRTKLRKYGSKSYNNREKAKETKLRKYGNENYTNKEKAKETNLRKYGVEHPLLNSEIKRKAINTLKEKYRISKDFYNPFELKEIQNKVKETNLRKYGVEHNSQRNLKNVNDLNKKFVEETFIDSNNNFDIKNFQLYYNISYSHSYKKLKEFNIDFIKKESRGEDEIYEFISSITNSEIIRNSKNIIPPFELDIYLLEYNLAIEYNGLYWHSEKINKDRKYHLNKTELCENKGIQLLHIFEHKWNDEITKDIIKSMISGKLNRNKKIYARNCKIQEVSNKEKNIFLNENHLQGQCQSSINIGLFYNNKLVSLMAFGRPRFNKNYKWELIRFCSIKYYNIIGGASKILKYFISNYGNSIITYADRTYSNGWLYDKLGFKKISINNPSYHYFINGSVINRMKAQKRHLPNLLKNYDPCLTEWQNMLNNGYNRFWDCGTISFEFNL